MIWIIIGGAILLLLVATVVSLVIFTKEGRGIYNKLLGKVGRVKGEEWRPNFQFSTGFHNGVLMDYGLPEKKGKPWVAVYQADNQNIIKVYDHNGNKRWEKPINHGGGDEHIVRWVDINEDGKDELICYDRNNNHSLVVCDGKSGQEISRTSVGFRFTNIAVCPDEKSVLVFNEYCADLRRMKWSGSGFVQMFKFGCHGMSEACHFPRMYKDYIIVGWWWLKSDGTIIKRPHEFSERHIKDHCDGVWIGKLDGKNERVVMSHQSGNQILCYDLKGRLQWRFKHPTTNDHYHNMRVCDIEGKGKKWITFSEERHKPPTLFVINEKGHLVYLRRGVVDQNQVDIFYKKGRYDIYTRLGLIDKDNKVFFPLGQEHELWNVKYSCCGVIYYVQRNGVIRTINPPSDNKENFIRDKELWYFYKNSTHRG